MNRVKWIFFAVGTLFLAFGMQLLVGFVYQTCLCVSFIPEALTKLGDNGNNVSMLQEFLTDKLIETLPQHSLALTACATIFTMIAFAIWYFCITKREPRVEYKKAFRLSDLLILVVLGLGCQILVSGLLQIVLSWPFMKNIRENYEALMQTIVGGNAILALVTTVILAPFAEELLFRGLILRFSKNAMPFLAANILQAAMFGLYHMNLVQGVYAFGLGLVLGYTMKKYNTIFMPIILHAIVNASAFVVGLIPDFSGVSYIMTGVGLLMLLYSFVFLSKKPDLDYRRVQENLINEEKEFL